MTDLEVLVLTDDELTCLAAVTRKSWALPLGGERDEHTLGVSAVAGERSLLARGLVSRRDGALALGGVTAGYVRPAVEADPELTVFVVDDQYRLVLRGMSLAWYRGQQRDVLEARSADGLHHFTSPPHENLVIALKNYVLRVHEAGFSETIDDAELSLCALRPQDGTAYLVRQNSVIESAGAGQPFSSRDWQPSTIDRLLATIP